ncbi:MAG: histidine triad family protein [Actinomycetota bacterium]|jgi:histidine triad (HIT) family protein|nr:histidine triad family protein [Actinomycetota bacterium]
MADDCLFCKIVDGTIDSNKVKETDIVLAFQDINPAAPTHTLVIPKKHIASAHDLSPQDGDVLGEIFAVAAAIADEAGISDGYRVVTNIGSSAGQSVFHLHFHVLGGRDFSWPPG